MSRYESNRIIIGSINNCFDNASQGSRYNNKCDGCWGTSICIGLAGTTALMVDGDAGYAQLQEEVAK